MTTRLMKRSGTTLIRDGGKAVGEKSEKEEACAGSWIQGCREEDDQLEGSVGFWQNS